MAKKKTPTTKKAPAPKTATKVKHPAQVTTAPSSPRPRDSNEGRHNRSTVPQSDNESANVDENDATSSNYGNVPITPNPNRPQTRTTNIRQHPGDRHNAYAGKRRTKDEMVEARRIAAINKAMKAEEAERQAMEREDSVRRIAEYEEGLRQTNIDDTPGIRSLHRTYAIQDIAAADSAQNREDRVPADMEATPVPKGRGQRRSSDTERMDVESGGEDGIAAPLESEATNQNDDDYAAEEDDEEDDEEYEVEEKNVKGKHGVAKVAKAGEKRKQGPKHATKNLKGVDNGDEDDEDARPKKKAKGVTKGLVPNAMVENMKEGGELKKKKAKPGVLLRDAVTALRSDAQERLPVMDSTTRGDKPKGYVLSHH
jgi:hypothetical protein